MLPMKKYNYPFFTLLVVALAWFTFSGCQTSTTASSSTAHLHIARTAEFGGQLTLGVAIDGAQVASLGKDQTYDGTLSAGQHVITLTVSGPNRSAKVTKTVTAQAGQTYSFTATWNGKRLVLV
jgi:hypothetical protein